MSLSLKPFVRKTSGKIARLEKLRKTALEITIRNVSQNLKIARGALREYTSIRSR
jgi:hypothetical protein